MLLSRLAGLLPRISRRARTGTLSTLGYPEGRRPPGRDLPNAVGRDVWRYVSGVTAREWDEARSLRTPSPCRKGAPTSPALANLTAYRLDCRLVSLARTAGAVYTRYADDLAFSGGEEFHRVVKRFSAHAAAVALEEGFSVNHHKTRVMRQGVRQQLTGVVVNRQVSLRRRDLELLEAILTNCVRFGPASQNREGLADFRAHLEGRVGFVGMVNRERGLPLRALFEAIRWEEA